jgi:hypothetical protein
MPSNVTSWTQAAGYTGTATFQTVYGTNGFTNFTVSGDVTLLGGAWTHQANMGGETNRLRVTVGGNLLVTNATISADGLGFSGGNGPGYLASYGAAHGGTSPGNRDNGGGALVNPRTYGAVITPTNLGSGASYSGGGAILLTVAGTTTVASAGAISANGTVGNYGASGGSVYLMTGWLNGGGTIRAKGGDTGWDKGGAGGGGRVAIILTGAGADFGSWNGTNLAYGGLQTAGGNPAAAGTAYRRTAAGVDTLIIDNANTLVYGQVSTLMPPAPNAVNLNNFSNVTIRNKGILGVRGDTTLDFSTFAPTTYGTTNSYLALDSDTNVTYPADWVINGYTLYANTITTTRLVNLTIGTNGVLSHYLNLSNELYKLNLTLSGNLSVLSNGAINADALGYGGGRGPGYAANHGGAYGGGAPTGYVWSTANQRTYGSITCPTNLGSGSPVSSIPNMPCGGGALLLTVAGTTTVASAGMISANGGVGNYGASGGSVYLRTGWLVGSGTIRAKGGDTGWNNGGGGGGGRVAIVLTGSGAGFSSWTGSNVASGGVATGGGVSAAAGTVYRQTSGLVSAAGTVTVDNGSTTTNVTFTSLPASSSSTESISNTVWVTTNKTRLGLVANASIDSLTLSTNGYLELSGYTLTVNALTVTNLSYAPGIYTPVQISRLTDAVGGGRLVVATPQVLLPAITNLVATNVTSTSADLVGGLISTGASATTVWAFWDNSDRTTNKTWAWSTNLAASSLGAITNHIEGIPSNRVYFFTYYASNSAGEAWARPSQRFNTYSMSGPSVDNDGGATDIGYSNAILRGTLLSGGAAYATIYWGTNPASLTNALGLGLITEGMFSGPLVLPASPRDVTCYYQCFVSNDYGTATAAASTNFTIPGIGITWTGAGTNNLASNPSNWFGNVLPVTGESVHLDGTTNKNMTWDLTNITVKAWNQDAGYSGTVTVQTVYGSNGFTNFTLSGDVTLSGGTWTHRGNTGGETNRLCVTVGGNVLISNATVCADGLGYGPSYGPAAGVSGTGYGSYYGASHGGAGYGTPRTYGSINAPTNLGSGGFGSGSAGGGSIVLTVAGTTTVAAAGAISANSLVVGGGQAGGAGGSIYLITGWLTGNGTVRANGGETSWNNGSAGGGGRLAIVLTGGGANFGSWTGSNTAYGGIANGGGIVAAAGTVYLKTAAGVDTLIVDNNNVATYSQSMTLMPSAPNAVNLNGFSNVVIRNKGILGVRGDTLLDFNAFAPTVYGPANSYLALDSDTNVSYPDTWTIDSYTLVANSITTSRLVNVTIGTNGVLSHYQNSTNEAYKLNLTLSGNLTVLSNGSVNADGLGFASGYGPGYLATEGAAYGGLAPTGYLGSAINPQTYGSIAAPTNLGSSGSYSGGGALLLTVAGTTTVNAAGTISAGGRGGNLAASGGSIYLRTGWLTGGGTIRANGGDTTWNNGAGGGGGRVAILLTAPGSDFGSWTGANAACGGVATGGGISAAAGTVYRQASGVDVGAGTVIVDNRNTGTNATFTPLPAFSNSTEKINQTEWVTTNKARIGLVTNTAIASLTLNANGVLELSGYTLTVRSLTVTNKTYRGGTYGPHDSPISLLTDAGSNGKVVVYVAGGTAYVFR